MNSDSSPSRRSGLQEKEQRSLSCFFFLFFFYFTSSVVIAVQYTGPGTTSMNCEVGIDKTVYHDKEKK